MAGRTVLLSPLELDDESDIRLVGARKGEAKRVWIASPGFGPYLRKCREESNLSLRKAGDRIGISHTYLSQIEQGDGPSPLQMDLYDKIADTYDLDDREVLHQAGCRYLVVEEVAQKLQDLEADRFERLMLHPLFKPVKFTAKSLKMFPESVRHFILEMAQSVDANARHGGPSVLKIIDGEGGE